MRENVNSRKRGRPGYGKRTTVTVRISDADVPALQEAAQLRGTTSLANAATALVYERLQLAAPAWVPVLDQENRR